MPRPTYRQAWNDLRAALTHEAEQLEKDAHAAKQRNLLSLFADLLRIRTRIGKLLRAMDGVENSELRRDDYAPRVAA